MFDLAVTILRDIYRNGQPIQLTDGHQWDSSLDDLARLDIAIEDHPWSSRINGQLPNLHIDQVQLCLGLG